MISALILGFAAQASASGISIPIRVDGEGYIRFVRSGKHVFGKSCRLVQKLGRLAADDGPDILPIIRVPGKPTDISVDLNGTVKASYGGATKTLGRIVLGDFSDDVRPVKSGRYFVCYGEPTLGNPGEGNFGIIRTTAEVSSETATLPDARTAVPSDAVAPVIKATAAVTGDVITLGDVADGAGKAGAIVLGDAPAIGITRSIPRDLIEARLHHNGFDGVALSGAPSSVVRRASQEVPHHSFTDVAIAKLKEAGLEAVLTNADLKPMPVPQGKLELLPEGVMQSGSSITVTVAAYVDGKRFNSRNISATSTIARIPRLNIGAIVTIRIKKGLVAIETRGKVLRVDTINAQITVEVELTRAQLTGKVATDGTVEVSA